MPGHKGVPLLGVPAERIDFTELSDTGNLYDVDDNVIREAERDAARAAGAAACVYSAGGSTLLIQGMLGVAAQWASARGRTLRVLAARDAHRSFFSAMALLGGDADYIYPQYNNEWNISEGIRADDVRAALAEREYDAVYVTSPTYYGVLSDLAGISEACADAGVLLLVDAAHGAHLVFGGSDTAPLWTAAHSSCRQGENSTEQQSVRGCARVSNGFGGKDTRTLACADTRNIPPPARQGALPFGIDPRCTYIMSCSAHKTLGALGGSAFALMSDEKLHPAMLASMQMFGSSSPSYVILASLDRALADASSDAGKAALAACAARVARLRERVAAMEGVRTLDSGDPTRFVFSVDGVSGFDAAEWLERERGVAAEMADSRNVVFIFTAQDTDADFARLEAAVRDCACRCAVPLSRRVCIPRDGKAKTPPNGRACGDASCVSNGVAEGTRGHSPVPGRRLAPPVAEQASRKEGQRSKRLCRFGYRNRMLETHTAPTRQGDIVDTAQLAPLPFAPECGIEAYTARCENQSERTRNIVDAPARFVVGRHRRYPARGRRLASAERNQRERRSTAPQHGGVQGQSPCWESRGLALVPGAGRSACIPARDAAQSDVGLTHNPPGLPERICSLRTALFSPTETVILRDADGRVAAEAIAPYPPGVPIIAPGEKISQKTIAFFIDIGYNVDKEVRVLAPQTSEREDIQ